MDGDGSRQTTEVRETNTVEGNTNVNRQTVATHTAVDSRVIIGRVIWFIAGFIIVLLALRIVMMLLGANTGAPFVDFLYAISGVFAWPFYGIFPQPAYGSSQFDSASLVAIVVYALLAWGVVKLLTLTSSDVDRASV